MAISMELEPSTNTSDCQSIKQSKSSSMPNTINRKAICYRNDNRIKDNLIYISSKVSQVNALYLLYAFFFLYRVI